jgi:ribosomal protein L37AE/L43A
MRKFTGFILICLLIWQTYEQFDVLTGYMQPAFLTVFPEMADDTISSLVAGLSGMLGFIIIKISFIDLEAHNRKHVKCCKCSNKIKKVAQNREVIIQDKSYEFTNKDGTKDLRRKVNILMHYWFEKYKCPKCDEVTTLEEYGDMPTNIYKEAK